MKTKTIYTLVLAFLLCSCDDFLDIVPVGKLVPTTIEDYELMFNGDDIQKLLKGETFYGAPNFGMGDERFRATDRYNQACYIWAKQIFDENSISYSDWGWLYSEIYVNNIILEQIGDAEGDEQHREKVIAEARCRRAFSYMMLMNIYAKQYDEATAGTDLGVSLRLDADVSAKAPARASVKEVYHFIETELLDAGKNLPDEAPNKFRLSKTVANALLARLYIMMRRYDDAWTYADLALKGNHFLYDYHTIEVVHYPGYGDYIDRISAQDNDENYLIRYYGYPNWGQGVGVATELYDLFPHDGSDLRENFEIAVQDQDNYLDSIHYNKVMVISIAPTVPEMYLTRAEGYARKGDAASLQKAMEDINHLRSFRVVPGTPGLQATTQDEVMEIVLAERRRELNIQGHIGWMDTKRLNKEPKYARTLTRTVNGKTYTLEPNSNNYALPIPYDVLGYNSDIVDNERD